MTDRKKPHAQAEGILPLIASGILAPHEWERLRDAIAAAVGRAYLDGLRDGYTFSGSRLAPGDAAAESIEWMFGANVPPEVRDGG